jgi:hypothetical protein
MVRGLVLVMMLPVQFVPTMLVHLQSAQRLAVAFRAAGPGCHSWQWHRNIDNDTPLILEVGLDDSR